METIKFIIKLWKDFIIWIIKMPLHLVWIIKKLIWLIKINAKIIEDEFEKWTRSKNEHDYVTAKFLQIWAFIVAPLLVVWFVIWIWF